MIVDLERFIRTERPHWEKLDRLLRRRAEDPWSSMSVEEVRELERLYLRTSADLARIATFSAEPEARRYLENLVARGYAEVHGAREDSGRFRVGRWFMQTWPRTFRRHVNAFWLALALLMAGGAFGALALALDPAAKPVIMPFPHLLGDPAERVAREERAPEEGDGDGGGSARSTFAGHLMTHNTRVALTAMALGLTWGIGTVIVVFYNGVILGAVVWDYAAAGQTEFLLAWLLPHGSVELPAILVGGQAGLVLASALLNRRNRQPMSARLRAVAADVVTLCAGAAVLLVWAGLVESFLSQHHEPVIPYGAKIAFGLAELAALIWFWSRAGRTRGHRPPGGRQHT